MFLKKLENGYVDTSKYGFFCVSPGQRKGEFEIRFFSPNPTIFDGFEGYETVYRGTDKALAEQILDEIIHRITIGEEKYSITKILEAFLPDPNIEDEEEEIMEEIEKSEQEDTPF